MKTINKSNLCLFFIFCLMAIVGPTMAQDNPTAKESQVKPSKGNSNEAIIAQLSGMSREEKNTMSRCPLHSKHMSLSDNYRADASDFREADAYPFAYQLNYRRYCNACTNTLHKEKKGFEEEIRSANKGNTATFERCALHGTTLAHNSDFDKVDFEKNPAADMPHAKQYLLKNFCKTCTKVYKIQIK